MNLQELEISQKLQPIKHPASYKLHNIMRDHGWNILGTGFEATVAEKPGMPYVLKVFPRNSKYVQFVQFCQQNPHNPYLPRFSRYVRPVPHTTFAYVRMEKLKPVNERRLMNTYAEYMCAVDQVFRSQDRSPVFWNHAMSRWDLDELPEKQGYADVASCAAEAPTTWTHTIEALILLMQSEGMKQFDLHPDNMMLRGNTLVITDPFVGTT
jgi:hypothetical protein